MTVLGVSPDGRYLLLWQQMGPYKGDNRAIPHLLDRQTGDLMTGEQVTMRTGLWSGHGFWIDYLVHLGMDLTVTTYPDLARALGETPDRGIHSTPVAPAANRVAALVGRPRSHDSFDLAWAQLDGTEVVRLPHVAKRRETELGNIATVALSPDGRYVAIASDEPYARIIDTSNPGEEQGVTVEAPANAQSWNVLVWAPDSRHLLVGGLGVVDLRDNVILPYEEGRAVWSQDGKSLIIPGAGSRPWTIAALIRKTRRTVLGCAESGRPKSHRENG